MLADLLKSLSPEVLITALKNNPDIAIKAIQKTNTFTLVGKALSLEQQVYISSNLSKFEPFLTSQRGKDAVSLLAEEFVSFTKA